MKKVLLISANTESNPVLFPIGLGYIYTSLLQSGFKSGILDFAQLPFQREVLLNNLNEFCPDFICISIRNIDNCCFISPKSFVGQIRDLVKWVKDWNLSVPVILGGCGFTLLPEEWLQQVINADYGIVGEGAKGLVKLLNSLVKGREPQNVPGLMYVKNGKLVYWKEEKEEKLDDIPFPTRRSLIHPIKEDVVVQHNLQTKRGCNLQCIYCAYPGLEGEKIRIRSAKNVVDEIQQMIEKDKIDRFDFVDNIFNNPIEHAVDICKEIIARGLKVKWQCFLNPAFCRKDFLQLMVEAGCVMKVYFGIP